MPTKSKIAVIAAVAALSFTSPALAQSYDNDWGTGNELPSYYDQNGALHAGNEHMRVTAQAQGECWWAGCNPEADLCRLLCGSDDVRCQ